MTKVVPVFVYGTLLPGEVNHDLLLRGKTEAEIPGTLRGAHMWSNAGHFKKEGKTWAFPFVALSPEDQEATVRGCIVTIKPEFFDDVLVELDDLENYVPGDPNNRYERSIITARDDNGLHYRCFIYVAAQRIRREVELLTPIPHGDWVRYLAESEQGQK